MAEKNSNEDQKQRSWGEALKDAIEDLKTDVFGKKGQKLDSAEDAVDKLKKRRGRP